MLKRASSSRVFPSKSLSRTSYEKKICPIWQTSRCFAGSVVGCATPWMRCDDELRRSMKMTLLNLDT